MKFSIINASQIYFWLKDISCCENFLSKIWGFIKLQKRPMWNGFFSIVDVNIPSIKELLHKPSEIQWNITRTLPGKLKGHFFFGLILQGITPRNHKKVRNYYFWGYFGDLGTNGIQWFFMILWISESFSLYLLVKNSFNFKLGFFIYF